LDCSSALADQLHPPYRCVFIFNPKVKKEARLPFQDKISIYLIEFSSLF
jgi:hypothetical protein